MALVIGNGRYDTLHALPNPPRDAAALAEALWNAGFEVIELIDADREQMINGIATFANRLRPGAEAVFYDAGHGVAVDNVNYLIPVATPVEPKAQLAASGSAARTVLQTMEQSGADFSVVILDACRNDPFDRGPAFQTAEANRGASVAAPGEAEAGDGVEPSMQQAVFWHARALADSAGDAELERLVSERFAWRAAVMIGIGVLQIDVELSAKGARRQAVGRGELEPFGSADARASVNRRVEFTNLSD